MEPNLTPESAVPERSMLEHGRILVKRRWAIYASLGLVLTIVGVATFTMRPIYRASAILQIEKDNPNILSFQDVFAIDQRDELFYQTQYRLIQSRTVARRVLSQLGSVPGPDVLKPGLVAGMKNAVKRLLGRSTGPTVGMDPGTRLVDGFLNRIRVEPYRNSRLVAVSFIDEDAKTAARIANSIAQAYIDFNMEAKYSTTEEASAFLIRQIESLKKEIAAAEKDLQSYGSLNQIVSLGEGEDIAARKLSDFNTSYTATQTDRIRKESRFRALKEAPPNSIPEVVESPMIQELKVRYAELERVYSQKSQTYKPEWPEMLRLRSEMDRSREMMESEARDLQAKLLQAAGADFQQALHQERSMGAALDTQKTEAVRVNRDSVEYANLRMEVDNKRNLLKNLMERQSETGLSARLRGLKSSNIRVVDAAEVPAFPYRPRVQVNLLLGLLLGLGLGVGMAFFLDRLDRSIKTLDDIKSYAGLPALGSIPPFHESGRRYGESHETAPGVSIVAAPHDVEGPAEIVLLTRPHCTASEAYRSLRTSLLLSSAEQAPRSLLVTSAHPGEGKTVTAVNVAVALVQTGKRVLLLDCDLRKPRLHKLLGVANDVGLTTCLTGNGGLGDAIARTRVDRLDLLPSGVIPPNPSELLSSKAFERLMTHLIEASGYDHVIVDSPPVLVVTDGLILCSRVDGVVLVVRASRSPREAIRQAVDGLRRAKGNPIGALLNGAETILGGSYRYGYRYGSGYGGPYARESENEPAKSPVTWSARLTRLRSRGNRRAL